MPKTPEEQRKRYTTKTGKATRQTAQMMLLKPALDRILRVRRHGVSRLENLTSPFVAFGNHSSHLDAALVISSLPSKLGRQVAVGAAGDHFYDKWWKAGPMNLFFNGFPINRGQGGRGERGMSAALLSDGVPLMIFPEGTRSRNGAMGPFKPGVAALCISNGCPAVPIALIGAFDAWPPSQKHLPKGRPEVHVVIGHPMYPQPGEIAHTFSERMRRQLLELHDTTAMAYGRKTLAEFARSAALEEASKSEVSELADDARHQAQRQEGE